MKLGEGGEEMGVERRGEKKKTDKGFVIHPDYESNQDQFFVSLFAMFKSHFLKLLFNDKLNSQLLCIA